MSTLNQVIKKPRIKRDKNADTPEITSKYYLSNKNLMPAIIESRKNGKLSDELACMLLLLTRRYAQKPSFNGYTFKEDMISEAIINLCQNALKFNPEKYFNPFSFYTSCIHNSFLQYLSVEKKHRRIRDQLLIDMGENPSFNFQEESRNHEYKDDFNELKTNIEEAKQRMEQDAIWAEAKLLRDAETKLKISNNITNELIVDNIFIENSPKLDLLNFNELD